MVSEFQNGFEYDEELFDKIKKDGIQEFSLIELELIDLTYRVTNAPLYIVDNDENEIDSNNLFLEDTVDLTDVVVDIRIIIEGSESNE